MVRTRIGWLVAVAALSLGVGACKKKDEAKKTDQTGQTAPAGDKANPVTATPSAVNVAAGDDLSLLPADSEMVMGLNVAQLQQSALWKQFGPKLMEKAAGSVAEFKAACGFDPFEAIKSVSFGMKNLDAQPEGSVVIHGLDKTKSMACMDKVKAEAAKKGTEVTVDGDVVTVKEQAGGTTVMSFVNNDTLLGVVGPNASKDTLLAAAKGGSTLKTSPTFVTYYSKINSKDSLWFLVNGNAPFMAKAASAGVGKMKAVYGSLNVTDGLTVDLRINFSSPEEATQLVTLAKGQTNNPQVKSMFDKLDVTADGADAKFAVAMSNAKLQQLIGMVGGMMGGMMGGGMGGP
ncbi:MAG: hypothetical protein HOV81_12385 [Kofleriaceae bacterium]|nr:hypothetical protein [Kofleriaceae bacterium]